MKRWRQTQQSRAGLTLIELILALGVTSLVAAGVAMVMFATARGTSSSQDVHGLVIKHKIIDSRLGGLVRSCQMVLATGSNYMVLWVFDTAGNGVPNRDEIRYIEFNSTTNEVWSYKTVWPSGWTQDQINAANTAYPLTTAFGTVIPALKGQATFIGERWATGVTGFSVTLNNAVAQSASLVNYTVTITQASGAEPVYGAAALRNWIVNAGGGN